MEVNINYDNIDGYADALRNIASEINRIYYELNYYYYGSIKSEGEYASAFGSMKASIQGMLNSMQSFMAGYADIVSGVARNIDVLDGEINALIAKSGF